jgi:FtsH-binding integral membrane protein
MGDTENLGSFFKDNKNLLKTYIETRLEIFRLSAIRMVSKSAGYLVWIIISLFLLFLIILFAGLVLGFWLSELTHSYVKGFGFTTLILLVVFSILAIFRKSWFVNPVIQVIIDRAGEDFEEDDEHGA